MGARHPQLRGRLVQRRGRYRAVDGPADVRVRHVAEVIAETFLNLLVLEQAMCAPRRPLIAGFHDTRRALVFETGLRLRRAFRRSKPDVR